MKPTASIDISENTLRNRGHVLDILLIDRSRHKPSRPYNIIWATDSYLRHGKDYASTKQIKRDQITGLNGKLIQPRAAKSKEEQKYRTKEKAEVFTPLKVVQEMNMATNSASAYWPADNKNWTDYISEKRLEITCGEAPFIAGRYDPVKQNSVIVPINKRVGFLDYKLKVVSEFVTTEEDWLKYAEISLKASYGYEWQGDNLLIARENVLLTVEDFYRDFCETKLKLKSKQYLPKNKLVTFAKIVSWNIWQMDGLKYVRPMSCHQSRRKELEVPKEQTTMFPAQNKTKVYVECEGCRLNNHLKHTGMYARIMDWQKGKAVKFVDLLNQ